MKEIYKFIGSYWKKASTPILMLLLSTITSFLYPLFPKWALDNVVSKNNPRILLPLTLVFLGVIALERIFTYFNTITFYSFQKESIISIQEKLSDKIFNYPMDFFDQNHSGYLLGRIRGDVSGLSYVFSDSLMLAIMDGIKFIGSFCILISMNLFLTLICLLNIPPLLLKIYKSGKGIDQINRKMLEENARLEKELSDTLQGIEVIKSFSREKEGKRRVSQALREYQKIEVTRNTIIAKYNHTIAFIATTGQVLLLYFGIREILQGRLSLGAYVAFMGYLIYLYSPLENLSAIAVLFNYAKTSYDRIKELFSILPEGNGTIQLQMINGIDIRGLFFAYKKDRELFHNFSFQIKKGDRILLSGESGSGKSTLMKLLIGLYRPQKGEILFNGVNMRELNIHALRHQIAFISQNIFLFNTSIRKNIIFDDHKISDERIIGILEKCRIKDKILSLEQGLDHQVSEKGNDFSGGEKQRISLARALIKNPQVIILDEAMANIESKTAKEIEELILEQFSDRIIFKISHRDSTCCKGWRVVNLGKTI